MVFESLKHIASDLNLELKRKFESPEDRVLLSNILDQDGSVPEENRNKVILSLLSMEHESTAANNMNGRSAGNEFLHYSPPLSFNMNIMFSCLFNQYEEGLKFLSETISFFQSKPVFNAANSPKLDERIFQLNLEVIKLDYSETFNLWSSLGAKYIPSIPFKVRMLTYQSSEITGISREVTTNQVVANHE